MDDDEPKEVLVRENFIVWFAVTGIKQRGRSDYHSFYLNYPNDVLEMRGNQSEYFNIGGGDLPEYPGVYKLHMSKYYIFGVNDPTRKIGYEFKITGCERICGLDLE